MTAFAEAIKPFAPLTATEAQAKIDQGEDLILFIGRSTCPYCRKFAPKLSRVAKDNGLAVSFIDSEASSDAVAIQMLRDRYGVATVPGLLVAKGGQVKVVCDSSLSEEAILDFAS